MRLRHQEVGLRTIAPMNRRGSSAAWGKRLERLGRSRKKKNRKLKMNCYETGSSTRVGCSWIGTRERGMQLKRTREAHWAGRGRNPLGPETGDVLWSARGKNPIGTEKGDVLWLERGRNPLWLDRRRSSGPEEKRAGGEALWPGGKEADWTKGGPLGGERD
jgi:hypothetical protein